MALFLRRVVPPLRSRTDSNLDPRASVPAAGLPGGGDGEQASASLSAQVASVETLLALWYRLRSESFVYKYAGEQEIKERGRRGLPEKVTREEREESHRGVICDTAVATIVSSPLSRLAILIQHFGVVVFNGEPLIGN